MPEPHAMTPANGKAHRFVFSMIDDQHPNQTQRELAVVPINLVTVATDHKFVAKGYVHLDCEPVGKSDISIDADTLKITKIEQDYVNTSSEEEGETCETLTFPTQQIMAFEEFKSVIELKVIIDDSVYQDL